MLCQHTQLCCQHPLDVAQALPHCARVGVLVLYHCHHIPRTIVPMLVVLLVYEHDVTAGVVACIWENCQAGRCSTVSCGASIVTKLPKSKENCRLPCVFASTAWAKPTSTSSHHEQGGLRMIPCSTIVAMGTRAPGAVACLTARCSARNPASRRSNPFPAEVVSPSWAHICVLSIAGVQRKQ